MAPAAGGMVGLASESGGQVEKATTGCDQWNGDRARRPHGVCVCGSS